MKEDLNKLKYVLIPSIGKLSTVKMSVCSKVNHEFTEIPVRLPK